MEVYEPENEREEVALFAMWCVGSCYGDFHPNTEREHKRVLNDDRVYAEWRERWVEFETNKDRGVGVQRLCGDPVEEEQE